MQHPASDRVEGLNDNLVSPCSTRQSTSRHRDTMVGCLHGRPVRGGVARQTNYAEAIRRHMRQYWMRIRASYATTGNRISDWTRRETSMQGAVSLSGERKAAEGYWSIQRENTPTGDKRWNRRGTFTLCSCRRYLFNRLSVQNSGNPRCLNLWPSSTIRLATLRNPSFRPQASPQAR
jgi:hypothetical protein